ncbi:molybdate-binding protein [Cryobacterium sp. MLB-32]|uniref:molybdate ABC transporter substrate-binding protein n=1 Tax=Cryobacterium sp. MLB-32 TaxID=1529318 RepID=UPI0004E632F6|nr:molybdate ABC transporter substrate-binding protein [Cryobacterium sp. MLB-32]KFF58875.1 molybdate-binding protein [Cryobacterium sp. MLB-32]
MTGRRALAAVAAVGLLLGLTACAPAAPDQGEQITVFAAASLTASFTEIAAAYEAEHPGSTIALNFAGSSDLVTQITEGAPADVFASADTPNMAKLTAEDLADQPVDFASNTLTIAVPPGNPARITSFADLARSGVKTVVCAPQVPCGAAAATVQRATGVALSPVSEESSVTAVLGKVSSGEADAGLVYVTDVQSAGTSVQGVPFPESTEAVNRYPIAALTASTNPVLAHSFAQYVAGPSGQKILQAAGFGTP